VNPKRIPQLGCLEEGKDEDGQSGVGEDDDLELGIASQRSEFHLHEENKDHRIGGSDVIRCKSQPQDQLTSLYKLH
jgi:hypothetical protein